VSEETPVEKKPRKKRSDAGKPRTAAKPPQPEIVEDRAPIFVRLRLKGEPGYIEFGCSHRTVAGGFHVFFYPSERDRYRETRREFAISEIREIEITEAPREREAMPIFDLRPAGREPEPEPEGNDGSGPRIHAVRRAPRNAIEQLETSKGPVKLDVLPGLTFGGSTA
jgi:hypothetical protein